VFLHVTLFIILLVDLIFLIVASIDALASAVQQFKGGVVLVSHGESCAEG